MHEKKIRLTKVLLSIFLLSWVACSTVSSSMAQANEKKETGRSFNSPIAANWSKHGGNWKVDKNSISVSGSPAKILIPDYTWQDFDLTVELKAKRNSQAGIIFRVSDADSKIDQYAGYYIGIDTGHRSIVWGAAEYDWDAIANRSAPIDADHWYTVRILARGPHVQAWVNSKPITESEFPKFDGTDKRFSSGQIGLRALGAGAEFRNLKIGVPEQSVTGPTYTNPVQHHVADPTILKFENIYYAYCTHSADHPDMKRGIRLYTSNNLTNWEDQGFVITAQKSWGTSRFWAPDIIQKDGVFYLYYAADTRICVAKSQHPTGPFVELPQSPMEPETVRIDAHVFEDGGKYFFYYVHFNQGNEIWGGELNEDMVTLKPETVQRMIQPDQPWECHQAKIVEGPVVLKHNDVYYLTYSGSHFESPHYAVGYATSLSPLGPWTKYPHNPIMQSTAYAHGTAHHCMTTSPDEKEIFIVYHRHHDLKNTEPRKLAIDRLRFVEQSDGTHRIEVHGPTATPQPIPSGSATGEH